MEHRGQANTGVIIVPTEKLKKIINSEPGFCTPQNNVSS